MNSVPDIFQAIESQAVASPSSTFLSDQNHSLTYQQTFSVIESLAERIRSTSDINCPCIILGDGLFASVAVLACLSITKPFIVINPESPNDRLQYYFRDSGADLTISPNEQPGGTIGTWFNFNAIPQADDATWSTTVDCAHPACLIYTSGTTGNPKAVVCPRDAMSNARFMIQHELDYQPHDVVFSALPMFFDFGLYQLFLAGACGATLYHATAAENSVGLSRSLARTRATILPMVPPAAKKLATLANKGLHPERVRMITTTGAAMDLNTREVLSDSWGHRVDIRVMYGLTECKRVAILPPHEALAHPEAAGKPLRGSTVTIRDWATFRPLPPQTTGEICVEGPHVMAGYHNQPDLTASKFVGTSSGPVLRSGDNGYIDKDGYLYCLGREDDQFKLKGYRVSLAEPAAAAHALDSVEDAIAIKPTANSPYSLFYSGDASEEAVRQALESSLDPHAVPPVVLQRTNLPTTPNGKIDTNELTNQARDHNGTLRTP